MPDFEKAVRGQRLDIPAATWNAVLDVTQRGLDQFRMLGGGPQTATPRMNFLVKAKNTTTGTVPRWGVMGITGVSASPPTGAAQFEAQPAIECVNATLSTRDQFVVAVEPIKAGEYGMAAIDGVVQVKIDIRSGDHAYAAAKPGADGRMVSVGAGPATILWKEPGTGENKWALVRIGAGSGSGVRLGKITGPWSKGTTAPVYEHNFDGTPVTGVGFEAMNRFATIQATGPTGAWVACSLYSNRWYLIAAECGAGSGATGG